MKDKKTITISLSLIIPIVLACLLFVVPPVVSQDPKGPFLVKRVVDGDTIVLADGRHIRYLGINTPEHGEPWWEEARDYNAQQVGGKPVFLEFGQVRQDAYGRVLAYCSVEGQMANAQLLKAGLAHLFILEPISYYHLFLRLQEEARAQGLGIWGKDGFTGPLKITTLHADAQGDDRKNLNGEYVRICNISSTNLNLRGFSLVDQEGFRYRFTKGLLKPGYTALLLTGAGKDVVDGADQLRLFWGSRYPIWNNKGDQASLRDPHGKLIDTFEYKR